MEPLLKLSPFYQTTISVRSNLVYMGLSRSQERIALLSNASEVLHVALYKLTIQQSFKQCGIYPLDRKKVLQQSSVGSLQSWASSGQVDGKRKRSAVSISFRVLTSEEVILELKSAHEKKKKKKKKVEKKADKRRKPSRKKENEWRSSMMS